MLRQVWGESNPGGFAKLKTHPIAWKLPYLVQDVLSDIHKALEQSTRNSYSSAQGIYLRFAGGRFKNPLVQKF